MRLIAGAGALADGAASYEGTRHAQIQLGRHGHNWRSFRRSAGNGRLCRGFLPRTTNGGGWFGRHGYGPERPGHGVLDRHLQLRAGEVRLRWHHDWRRNEARWHDGRGSEARWHDWRRSEARWHDWRRNEARWHDWRRNEAR